MAETVSEFVSTGILPSDERVRDLVEEAHRRILPVTDGENSAVYPALEKADTDRFGICVVGVTGNSYSAGDAEADFTIMSVAKPFIFALVCELFGPGEVRAKLGANATGLPFNAVEAVERTESGHTNPMVNPGAIAATSLVPGANSAERWETIAATLSRFAGRTLSVDENVYASATATNFRNRDLAAALAERGAIYSDPEEALDLYTRQSSVRVTALDLATMGATLADGGINPRTGVRVVSESTCRYTLSIMATAGLYETSGDWLYDIGLPGKSGIGGGIVTVSPGKGGLGTFSPRLDAIGNSVRGVLVARFLSRALGLDIFASRSP
jgi:glutaminase